MGSGFEETRYSITRQLCGMNLGSSLACKWESKYFDVEKNSDQNAPAVDLHCGKQVIIVR